MRINTDAAQVAQSYWEAKLFAPDMVASWECLADSCMMLAKRLETDYQIVKLNVDNPYADAVEMFHDFKSGIIKVSTANCEHPIFTVDQNVAFRIAHDYYGHFQTGGDFGWDGELMACSRHFKLIPPMACQALYCECICQTAFGVVNGEFIEQKVARF